MAASRAEATEVWQRYWPEPEVRLLTVTDGKTGLPELESGIPVTDGDLASIAADTGYLPRGHRRFHAR